MKFVPHAVLAAPVLAAPVLAILLSLTAGPTLAAAAPAIVQATAPADDPGVSIEAVRAWLTSKGGAVSEINRRDGATWITVADGPLTWVVSFYSCQTDVCGDIQYSATFTNPGITQGMINDWNREQRFLKAFYSPGAEGAPTAVVQYDVLIGAGGVEQLTDHTALWLNLVAAFATTVGYFTPAGAD